MSLVSRDLLFIKSSYWPHSYTHWQHNWEKTNPLSSHRENRNTASSQQMGEQKGEEWGVKGERETWVKEEEQTDAWKLWEKERNRGETSRGRQTKLGHVTWLGLTAGRIKYPTACGHLHNKCSFHFINYFSSMGNEARHSECDAALYSGWQWGFSHSIKTKH